MASKGKQRFGPKVPGGAGDMLKRLEALQAQMAEMQARLEEEVVTASVGGGAVTIEMTGAQEVRAIRIRPDVVNPEDVEMLQDLILAAFREAQERVRKLTEERMSSLTGGLEIPGLLG